MSLLDLVTQALGASAANQQASQQHIDQVTAQAPSDVLGRGLAGAFRSDQTPPIGDMVSNLFGRSNGQQQAGMLNQLIAAIGPAAAAALAGGALSKVLQPGQTQLTEQQASQLTPAQVRDVVNQADQQNPGIAEQLGNFYAEHRGLINTLGGLAASVALMHMKDHLTNRE